MFIQSPQQQAPDVSNDVLSNNSKIRSFTVLSDLSAIKGYLSLDGSTARSFPVLYGPSAAVVVANHTAAPYPAARKIHDRPQFLQNRKHRAGRCTVSVEVVRVVEGRQCATTQIHDGAITYYWLPRFGRLYRFRLKRRLHRFRRFSRLHRFRLRRYIPFYHHKTTSRLLRHHRLHRSHRFLRGHCVRRVPLQLVRRT